ncbi:MAG: hypothetical protein Q8P18_13135 [Pseudomonadota bacterium]|nr:hypothetical protein [Pseudomonadota bacterium]
MPPRRADGLTHPLALGAMLVLAANDHWGKAAWPGVVTGKLSDVAGLVFFPLLLQALWELGGGAVRRRVLVVCCVVTALGFVAVKIWPPAHALYEHGLGLLQWPYWAARAALTGASTPPWTPVSLAADPTDLIAIPAVLGALWAGRRRDVGAPERTDAAPPR